MSSTNQILYNDKIITKLLAGFFYAQRKIEGSACIQNIMKILFHFLSEGTHIK